VEPEALDGVLGCGTAADGDSLGDKVSESHPASAAAEWMEFTNRCSRCNCNITHTRTHIFTYLIYLLWRAWWHSSVVKMPVFGLRNFPALRPIYD